MTAAEDVFGDQFATASLYVDILRTRGIEWGLLGPREEDRIWGRHLLNSVALSDLLPQGSAVVDVGSGAGLPGIPLAIRRPDLRVVLMEPLLRRATFLSQAVDELELGDRVQVVRARADEHHEHYDAVVSRALAPLERLVPWCDPLRSPTGVILALKGRSAGEELGQARKLLQTRRLVAEELTPRAHPAVEPATVVRMAAAGSR